MTRWIAVLALVATSACWTSTPQRTSMPTAPEETTEAPATGASDGEIGLGLAIGAVIVLGVFGAATLSVDDDGPERPECHEPLDFFGDGTDPPRCP